MSELWNYNWLYQSYQTQSKQFPLRVLSKEVGLPEQETKITTLIQMYTCVLVNNCQFQS